MRKPYLIKIRHWLIIVALGFSPNAFIVHANSGYDVDFRVIDAHHAEIKLTYPVLPGMTVITALSSKKGGSMLDGHRDLVIAHAQDGSPRPITHNTLATDAQIAIQPGDQKITLTYRLTNTLSIDDISLFNFLLFFGTEYPSTAHIKMSAPEDLEIVSHSGINNTKVHSDGSVTTDVGFEESNTALLSKNLHVLVYPKTNSSYQRKVVNNFELFGTSNKIKEVDTALRKISFAPKMFKDTLGVSLPSNIYIIVTPIVDGSRSYEARGRVLPPNLILIDPHELNFYKGPHDAEKIILHELGHLALANKGIFSRQSFNARWFDEGIAVFVEQYATDNHLIKDSSSRQIDTVLSNIKKMTLHELIIEYKLPFDYSFAINTKEQPIDRTYNHAGLIVYNLFLFDQTFLHRVLNSLQSAQSNFTCKDCDTDTILTAIQSVSGMAKDDIVYPHRNNLTEDNHTLSRLTLKEVNEATQKKIKEDRSKAIGSYIDKDAPVESFDASSDKEEQKTIEVKDNIAKQETTLEKKKDRPFFTKIRLWLMSLFKKVD